jgi:BlaI family transcriptional regulator, penicillinase repressor
MPSPHLSRREREAMDVIYQRGETTAAEVRSGLSDAPSYSAVRALLATLVSKGFLAIREDGPRYIYFPTHPRQKMGRSALLQVVRTFFEGSAEKAMAALLDRRDLALSDEELGRLRQLIDQTRRSKKR